MAKRKKKLVKHEDVKKLDYIKLVNIVRSRGRVDKKRINDAYNELETRVKPKIMYIVSQFYIPGCSPDDVYQEALYALRFKAIPDYDKSKGNHGPYPFDNFAVLCIRRHLSTKLKSSFQNKKKALNTSISLDQDRNNDNNDSLFLSDILPKTSETISDTVEKQEYYKGLIGGLFSKLSKFEKKVFMLYIKKYSYEEIAVVINKSYKSKGLKKRVNVKSVDNALSRLKQKGKDVFDKYGEVQ